MLFRSREHQIPVIQGEGSEVRIISGFYEGKAGPEQGDYVKTLYLDIKLEPDASWDLSVNPGNTLFIYIVRGSVHTDNQEVPYHRAVLFGEGDTLSLKAGSEGARIFLYSAKPLGEPIAWAGPIVMNTREELSLAQRELREGTFIKHA